jgi:hypothetical protein
MTGGKRSYERTYHTGRYYSFYVYDPKKRKIFALPFRDRVIQHALSNIIEPIFDSRFIYDSYACRNNKGTHKAADRLTYFLRKLQRDAKGVYCLKADIEKYFPSISHQILIEIIKRKIRCRETLWLIEEIIHSTVDKEQIASNEEPSVIGCNSFASKGIPIGNLTSQIFANIYLNELDYFIKHNLKCPYYLRYMDDFIILDKNKKELHQKKEFIEEFLGSKLELRLNKKSQIFPVSCGIDFLGCRIWKTHRLLRKSNIKRMKRKLRIFQELYSQSKIGLFEIKQSLMSWLGHISHANSYNLKKKIFSEFVLRKERNNGTTPPHRAINVGNRK